MTLLSWKLKLAPSVAPTGWKASYIGQQETQQKKKT